VTSIDCPGATRCVVLFIARTDGHSDRHEAKVPVPSWEIAQGLHAVARNKKTTHCDSELQVITFVVVVVSDADDDDDDGDDDAIQDGSADETSAGVTRPIHAGYNSHLSSTAMPRFTGSHKPQEH